MYYTVCLSAAATLVAMLTYAWSPSSYFSFFSLSLTAWLSLICPLSCLAWHVLALQLHLLLCHLLPPLPLATSPFPLYLSPLFFNCLALTGVSFFSLHVVRLSTAASLSALLPPASPSSNQALHLFSNSNFLALTSKSFSLSSAVSNCLPSLCSNVQWTS